MPTICIIAAIGENGVIGSGGKIPWHLPADFKNFKELTMGYPVIMGRKTFESIGKPLPGRTNIVITRDSAYEADGIVVVHSFEAALEAARGPAPAKIFILGGAEVYAMALPVADALYITKVHGAFEGDAFFPAINAGVWRLTASEPHTKDEKNAFDFDFLTYEKKSTMDR